MKAPLVSLSKGGGGVGKENVVSPTPVTSSSIINQITPLSATSSAEQHHHHEYFIASSAEFSACNDYNNVRHDQLSSSSASLALQQHNHHYGSEIVRNPDGTPLLDHNSKTIPIEKMLSTKPLKADLMTRPGPGGRKLTYMSGDSVTRTLNDIFGFDGWSLEIKATNREECIKDDKHRYHVAYTATVRLTHRRSGAYKEDCGAGDAIDKSIGTAVGNALKASVTDAVKRAARHFGEKLGNGTQVVCVKVFIYCFMLLRCVC